MGGRYSLRPRLLRGNEQTHGIYPGSGRIQGPPTLSRKAALWHGRTVKLLFPLLVLFMSVGCAPETAEKLTAGNSTYKIPSRHVSTVTREPHTFVRIKHPKRPYDLIYDSRSQGVTDARGAPVIFSINDGQSPGIEYHRSPLGTITCRRAANPRGGCGTKLRHGENEWSIVFPEGRRGEAEAFIRDAVFLLRQYEVSSR